MSPWVASLACNRVPRRKIFRATDVWRPSVDKHGAPAVCGGRGLKQTQAYPRAFGKAIAKHLRAADPQPWALGPDFVVNQKDFPPLRLEASDDAWGDAQLAGVYQLLRCNAGPP